MKLRRGSTTAARAEPLAVKMARDGGRCDAYDEMEANEVEANEVEADEMEANKMEAAATCVTAAQEGWHKQSLRGCHAPRELHDPCRHRAGR